MYEVITYLHACLFQNENKAKTSPLSKPTKCPLLQETNFFFFFFLHDLLVEKKYKTPTCTE